jgi:hypothetical protein
MTIWILFQALSNLLLSIPLNIICFYAFVVMGFFANMFVDSITRDFMDNLKMILIAMASMAVIVLSLASNAVVIELDAEIPYPTMSGDFRIAVLILMALVSLVTVYGSIKISIHTPKNLKKYSLINILGTYLWTIQPLWFQFSKIEQSVIGISTFSMGAGILINAIVFIKKPKLAYIIPFKAYRIMIQNTNTGIILFKHDWNKLEALANENIFSGNMQAISTIFDLTINQGNVRKIKFDKAEITFIVSEKVPLTCILISSRSSITLRSSFDKFANDVFKDYIIIEKNSHSTNKYENGIALLEKHFPFIP